MQTLPRQSQPTQPDPLPIKQPLDSLHHSSQPQPQYNNQQTHLLDQSPVTNLAEDNLPPNPHSQSQDKQPMLSSQNLDPQPSTNETLPLEQPEPIQHMEDTQEVKEVT